MARAREASIRLSDNARQLILNVASSSKKDLGYTFARIEYARRTKNFNLARDLLLSAPRDPRLLVDPDEWWVERRIVARHFVETGKYRTAYNLVALHSAQSASAIIDAEFHAGWIALRFLKDRRTAQVHFSRIVM